MATATLTPASQNAAGGWTDEANGATNLHLVIDEATASPGTDYLRGQLNAATTVGYWATNGIPAVPSSVTLNIRHSRGGVEGGDNGGGNDTHTLFAQVWNAAHTTALTDELTVETGTAGYLVKTENIGMTGIAGTATDWGTPHLALRTGFTKVSTNDGDRMWVDLANLSVVYTLAPVELAGAAAGTGTASGTVDVGKRLTGSAAGIATAAAALTVVAGDVTVPLIGAAAAVATAGGSLDVGKRLNGSAAAVSTAGAGLDVGKRLNGAATALTTAAATLRVVGRNLLAGQAEATSSAVASVWTSGSPVEVGDEEAARRRRRRNRR